MLEIDEVIEPKNRTSVIAKRLGYAGLIPFAAAAIMAWLRPPQLPLGYTEQFLHWTLVYGALILSFLGGAQWGAAIQSERYGKLLSAVLWALIGWLAVIPGGILPGVNFALNIKYFILFVAFTLLLVSELVTAAWDSWYLNLRMKITAWVLALLFTTALGVVY